MPSRFTTSGQTARPLATARLGLSSLALAAAVAVAPTAPLSAQTTNTTLTFNNVSGSAAAGGVRRVNNCVVENGVRVTVLEQAGASANLSAVPCETGTPTPSTPTALATFAPGNGSYLGSPALFNDVGSAIEFTSVMGGGFSLFSLDLAPIFLVPAGTPLSQTGSLAVTFTGFRTTGPNLTQMFNLALNAQGFSTVTLANFTNLSAARVTFGGPDFAAQVDNVNVGLNATVIPEPSTYALMATGLLGLGAIARRRRTSTTS